MKNYFYNIYLFIIVINRITCNYKHNRIDSRSLTNEIKLPIFINQSDNINIIAKYGHTVHLPCLIYKTMNEQSNIHVIWSKLNEKLRTKVLTIGLQQLTFDLRYRIRIKTENSNNKNDDDDESKNITNNQKQLFLIENWQLEIRKVTYDDNGLYQCSLPLVNPQYKNITLKIIPDLTIHPKKSLHNLGENIHIKCHTNLTISHKKYHNGKKINDLIKWFKDDKYLTSKSSINDDNIEINTKLLDDNTLYSELRIKNVNIRDTAIYRCVYEGVQEKSIVTVVNQSPASKSYLIANNCFIINHKISQFNIIIFSLLLFIYLFNI